MAAPDIDNDYKRELEVQKFAFTKYNPTYAVYGDPLTKLQFSFKYQLLKKHPLYFGYTQLIFWDLGGDSKPIKDVNYGPDLFWRQDVDWGFIRSIDFGPLSHLSNGKAGNDSRGYNKVYAQFNMLTPLFNNTLSLTARLTSFYDVEDTNSDISNYVSPLELGVRVTEFFPQVFDKGELYLRVFPGGNYAQNWGQGGQEIGLSFRPSGIGLAPAIFVQYYGGYAESLLYYNRFESTTRFGIIF